VAAAAPPSSIARDVALAPAASAEGGRVPLADGPPPAHTGGFGEPTCHACHSEAPVNPPGGEVRVQGLPAAYRPGASYDVTVVLDAKGTVSAGFQAAIRFTGTERSGLSAGSIRPLDERASVQVDTARGVAFVQHTRRGTVVPEGPGSASWSFRWTAPEAPGPVVLHVAANSADGDDSPFGDLVYATSVTSAPEGSGRLIHGDRARGSGVVPYQRKPTSAGTRKP